MQKTSPLPPIPVRPRLLMSQAQSSALQFHLLSFEGPDPYAQAGGIASRITGLAQALADDGFATHLWFVGDPSLPGEEIHWNANNTFSFDRIDRVRLVAAAIITTVSRYMKHLMHALGVHALVLPNGIAAADLVPPHRRVVQAFRRRVQGRTMVSKVARWDPDKGWVLDVYFTSPVPVSHRLPVGATGRSPCL